MILIGCCPLLNFNESRKLAGAIYCICITTRSDDSYFHLHDSFNLSGFELNLRVLNNNESRKF